MSRFRPNPGAPAATPEGGASRPRKRVLFVCIGNICRSPMAEALANKYGADVLKATSAGLSAGMRASPQTRKALLERMTDVPDHTPTPFDVVNLKDVDLIVNMSGYRIPPRGVPVEDWDVRDPIGESDEVYRGVRDQIESLVMNLVLRLRSGKL